MVGITSYGAYIPRYRLSRMTIFKTMGWFNPATAAFARGEKAVANYDEDCITMSVAAACDCLNGFDRNTIGGLYLSSTTTPYAERQNAGICASALALRQDIRTADFSASLKSGTTALISACDTAKSGNINNILVCSADSRQAKPGSSLELSLGDGACALTVGTDNIIAQLKGSYSISCDFVDYRRTEKEKFITGWEERWIKDEGHMKILPNAINGFLSKYNHKIDDFTKIVIACPDAKSIKVICKKLKINPDQIQDNLMNQVGNTGAALSLMMLTAALETAKPKDKILLASYGNGSDVLFFEVTDKINNAKNKIGIKGHLGIKKELDSYAKYQVFRNMIPLDVGLRGEERPLARMSMTHREGKAIASLCGSKCKVCGTPQFPKQRVCITPECKAIDQMEDYYFYDKVGRINSFTGDNLAFCWDPPEIYGLIDFEDGGRVYLDFTDCDLDSLKVGLPVTLSFRRKHIDNQKGVHTYFWKAVPMPENNS